ncbi:hypothetical protein CC80DRAFT_314499 [Byssothecium circinans]|uniref:Uncharacterized protein n=1 Tax=Byssothecium circinans TaxID=147558 RepID=A0A6A5THW1_9PLEO|nr:hypothetical protein CC80DRAFT_314499 [Byssothecium circinans]
MQRLGLPTLRFLTPPRRFLMAFTASRSKSLTLSTSQFSIATVSQQISLLEACTTFSLIEYLESTWWIFPACQEQDRADSISLPSTLAVSLFPGLFSFLFSFLALRAWWMDMV